LQPESRLKRRQRPCDLMNFVLFYHSLISDWNNGHAHFLRGVAAELLARRHHVTIFEPAGGWSLESLRAGHGETPIADFHAAFPTLKSQFYSLDTLDLNEALDAADVVIVHEWNAPELIARIGRHRAQTSGYRLLFHDAHHRAVTMSASLAALDLSAYDGVLAFGEMIRDIYLQRGWTQRAWTWHEAADTRVFRPLRDASDPARVGDLIWIGNWGDDERTEELHEFLLEPVRRLNLAARVHGVRYPQPALDALQAASIAYGGWLANYRVPDIFARFKATLHVPRRVYRERLPGVPTIRVFEALACGIPLICAPWEDSETLFRPGEDFLIARDGAAMEQSLRVVLNDRDAAQSLAEHGRETILARHTCADRVDELLGICDALEIDLPAAKRGNQKAPCTLAKGGDQEISSSFKQGDREGISMTRVTPRKPHPSTAGRK
jgi:spore maturation protein CgeB